MELAEGYNIYDFILSAMRKFQNVDEICKEILLSGPVEVTT